MQTQKTLDSFIHHSDFKLTTERKLIIKEVSTFKRHFEADELFLKLRQKGKKVSRATIYRTLQLLVDCGFVRPLKLGENHAHYEQLLGKPHHDHLVCVECGKVIEFSSDNLNALHHELSKKYNFTSTSYHVEISGLCQNCYKIKSEGTLENKKR